ncbi:MAG: YHYH protein, partial [Bacteroidota bacterium]
YATTEMVNDAIAWTGAQTEPYFLWLAFNAPHPPYHLPPADLHTYTGLSGTQADINANPVPYFKASLQALDTELGRLFDSLEAHNQLDSTDFIFIGDNGNTMQTTQAPNITDHAKGTIYQYGAHVPMIISGPSVVNPGRVSDAQVNVVDLFSTILELFGFCDWHAEIPHARPVDSRSILPILSNLSDEIRPWAFTEIFYTTPTDDDGKAMRNQDYKLLKFDGGNREFYHLANDSLETNNLLLGNLTAEQQANYAYLNYEMVKLAAQGNPVITSWLRNSTGITGRHYVEGNSTPIIDAFLANVQSVKYSTNWVYVTCTGIPAYIIGPYLDGNPSQGQPQSNIYKIPLNPAQNTGNQSTTTPGTIGVFINGVSLFDYRDGVSWDFIANMEQGGPLGGMGDGVWNRDAVPAEMDGFDCDKGHPANGNYHHHQNPSAFDMDLVEVSNICDTYPADALYVVDSTEHSPLLGFAYDGFPIYGAYSYLNKDGTGGVVRMKSSYGLRNITVRTHYADGTNVTDGPPVSTNYPLGRYREDYEFNPSEAPDSLDEHNGRFCVTPEYPNGIYCYFTTVDENWNSYYPYAVGPTFYGIKNVVKVASITESTTTWNGLPLTALAVPTSVACFGNSTGSINLYVNGGNPPYTYNWGNGINTQNRTGLAAGTYTVTATDVIGQTATQTATVTQPASALSVSPTSVNVDCFGNATGSISLAVSGGTTGYSFAWNDGNTMQNRTALVAGIYSATVTDAHACTATVSQTITQPPGDSTEISMLTCDPNQAGVTYETLTNQSGCDSTIVTTTVLIPTNLLVVDNALPGGIYRSTGALTSHTTTVADGLDVQFISDESVNMEHNFLVETGAIFEAKIEPCPPSVGGGSPVVLKSSGKKEKEELAFDEDIILDKIMSGNGVNIDLKPSLDAASDTGAELSYNAKSAFGNINLKIYTQPGTELILIQSQAILKNTLYLKLN